ncbi:AlpA family phage regulatory protein [Methylobacter svalbardensis]|uniref:helix-turn-helix transcriptional regulator n=1 Tax=Methylobacter svalbardensis TaxID=3080016 RepID=UPI0030EE51BF
MPKLAQATPLNLDYLKPPQAHQLPETGYLRLWHVIGDPKATPPIPALIPIGRTSFLNGVKSGKYPKPVKLGERTTAWKVEDIRALIGQLGGAA